METSTAPQPKVKFSIDEEVKLNLTDQSVFLGYLLLAISAGLFVLGEYHLKRGENNFTVFFIHYFIAIGFVIALLFNKSYGILRSWRKENIHKTVILLNLFLVSAYALNRELPVFENSVPWFCVFILLTSVVMLSYRYFDVL